MNNPASPLFACSAARVPRRAPAAFRVPAARALALAALLGVVVSPAVPAARAATTYVWRGGGANSNWSTAANWATSVAPPSDLNDTDLSFGPSNFLNPVINQDYSVHALVLNSGGQSYNFGGNGALTLGGGGLTQNSPAAQTFNNPVLVVGQTWNLGFASGALTFNGGINTTTGFGTYSDLTISAATIGSSGNVLNGAITGGGGLIKTGMGTLTLTGASTYTGNTNVNAGTLAVTGSLAGGANLFPNVTLTVNGTSTAAATLSLSGSGSVTMNQVFVGYDNAGTVNQSGGTLTDNVSPIYVGYVTGGQGTYNLSGGTLSTTSSIIVGNDSVGTFNQTGGTLSATRTLSLGQNRPGNGTYNLTGGTLSAGAVQGGAGTSTFNFNGGTLQARSNTTSFLQGLTTANVQTGGARIDTNGSNLTVAQTLVHDTTAGAAATDGGLTKLGAGTLTLTGANTYTGTTTISAGTLQVGNGGTTGTLGSGSVTDSAALTFNRSDNLTVANNISGGGRLTQAGGGTLTLTGTNTYAGGTTLASGTLQVGSANALGIQGPLLFTGGTLRYSAANQTDYSARFSSAAGQAFSVDTNGQNVSFANGLNSNGGSLTKRGTGTLALTDINNYTGNTTVSAGTLAISGSLNSGSGATLTVDGGATGERPSFTQSGNNSSVSTGGVSVGGIGMGSVNQSNGVFTTNGGGLTLGAASSATGSYTQSGGSLSTGVARVGASGFGTFTQSGGSFTTNGNDLTLALDAGSTGTLNLSGASGTLLSTGAARVGASGVGIVNQSGGSFTTNNNFLLLGAEVGSSGAYTLTGGSLSIGTGFIGFHGSGSVTQGGGTFANANGNTLLLAYDAGVSGAYSLNGGTLTTAGVTAGSGVSTFNFNGGTLRANAGNTAFLQGLSTASVQAGGARIDANGFSVSVAQALVHDPAANAPANDGGLTKLGGGVLTLTGANTYTGPTNVSAGTLLVNNASGSATGGGAVAVLGGATLGGSGTIGGSVTVESGATLAPGNSPGRLTLGGSLALQSGSTLALELGGTTAGSGGYDQVALGGTLSVAGANLNVTVVGGFTLVPGQTFFVLDRTGADVSLTGLFANAPGGLYTDAAGDTFQVNYAAYNPADGDLLPNDVSLTVAAIPEPSPGALLLLGAALGGGLRLTAWRRRRQAA